LWRTVQEAPLAPEVREILAQVLEFWFFERFRGLTAQQIRAMLHLGDFRERIYRRVGAN
jgi:hypothetical protein